MRITLIAAAAYNIVWGAWVVLFPEAMFQWSGVSPPLYPQIWQCFGMIVAVYGIGYAIAARSPFQYWPLVLVGLVGKILGPIGFLQAAAVGHLPWSFGLFVVTNDLIWIAPFALILRSAYIQWLSEDSRRVYEEAAQVLLETLRTNSGETVAEMSRRGPVLMAFLRHSGCPFCKEAAADLAREKAMLEKDIAKPKAALAQSNHEYIQECLKYIKLQCSYNKLYEQTYDLFLKAQEIINGNGES